MRLTRLIILLMTIFVTLPWGAYMAAYAAVPADTLPVTGLIWDQDATSTDPRQDRASFSAKRKCRGAGLVGSPCSPDIAHLFTQSGFDASSQGHGFARPRDLAGPSLRHAPPRDPPRPV